MAKVQAYCSYEFSSSSDFVISFQNMGVGRLADQVSLAQSASTVSPAGENSCVGDLMQVLL